MAIDPFSRAVKNIIEGYLPTKCRMPLYCMAIPLTIQFVFRAVRQSAHTAIGDARDPKITLKKRNIAIRIFLGIEAVQALAFVYFSGRNRWFLMNAAYSLGHCLWISYLFHSEQLVSDQVYRSMDGDIKI